MIAGVIAFKAKFENVTDFTILYSSELLMSVDEAVYTFLNALFGLDIKQKVYRPDLAFEG